MRRRGLGKNKAMYSASVIAKRMVEVVLPTLRGIMRVGHGAKPEFLRFSQDGKQIGIIEEEEAWEIEALRLQIILGSQHDSRTRQNNNGH